MSLKRKLRRKLERPDLVLSSGMMREMLFSPAEKAELAVEGVDVLCDEAHDYQEKIGMKLRCPFRKGHSVPCRFFGDISDQTGRRRSMFGTET